MSPRRVAATTAIVAAAAALVGTVLLLAAGAGWPGMLEGHLLPQGVAALAWAAAGAAILYRLPTQVVGRLLLGIGVALGVDQFASGLALQLSVAGVRGPALSAPAWAAGWLWVPGLLELFVVVLVFPDGALGSRRWRPVFAVAVASIGVASIAAALTRGLTADVAPGAANPFAVAAVPDELAYAALGAAILVCVVCGLAGMVGLGVQMVRASGARRRQLAWFFVAVSVFVAGQASTSAVLAALGTAALPVGLGIAMLRHGLFDGDRLLGPTVVYGVLTALVTATFALAVGLAGSKVGGGGTAAVATALVVAVALSPVREAVQQVVDRLLYGGRRDPYTALSGLGSRLCAAPVPDAVPAEIVSSVASALRVPHVTLTLTGEDEPAVTHGAPVTGGGGVRVALRYAGTQVGTLTVGLRRGRRHLDPGDERLLHDFAAQVGPAVHAAALVRDLRRSHDRLVDERDAERARVRRDLHDGLGPVLAGVALGIEAAARAAGRGGEPWAELLGRLGTDVHSGLHDVRRIVDDLRPTDLACGLPAALGRLAADTTGRAGGGLRVDIDLPAAPTRLPEAVEVAAYRIVAEALSNAARHSGAQHCRIRLRVDDHVRIEVCDDGEGLPVCPTPGIGTASMARRAAELGGRCALRARTDGGTIVEAVLPIREAQPGG